MGRREPNGRLGRDDRLEIRDRIGAGQTHQQVADAVGCSTKTIQRLLIRTGGLAPRTHRGGSRQLTLAEREEISRGVKIGESYRSIARSLGRAPSTVSREVEANGQRKGYRAWRAEGKARKRARRPKLAKLARCPRLRREVERGLAKRWSPEQISHWLQIDFPTDPEMRVSHETIYRSLYVQARGALRKELTAYLRTGRTRRRSPRRRIGEGRLKGMISISARPAEAADRAVPGHWEGDLIIGTSGGSAIGTLVERRSLYVVLVHLEWGRTAVDFRQALAEQIGRLPEDLRRTLTWDQGKEMVDHVRFTVETGLPVYFCDPRSPWQRASIENTNGLLRQYFPRSSDLSIFSRDDLSAVARELNSRPRRLLDWQKPCEVFAGSVATTG